MEVRNNELSLLWGDKTIKSSIYGKLSLLNFICLRNESRTLYKMPLSFLIFIAVYLSNVVKKNKRNSNEEKNISTMVPCAVYDFSETSLLSEKKNQIIKLHFYGLKSIGKDFYCSRKIISLHRRMMEIGSSGSQRERLKFKVSCLKLLCK